MADVVAGFALQSPATAREAIVLLGLRKATGKRGGLWEMPGGKVEVDEDHSIALRREWREELGVEIDVGERIASAMLDLEVCFTVHLYVVHKIYGVPTDLDHERLEWTSLQRAIEYMPCSPALYIQYPMIRQYLRAR